MKFIFVLVIFQLTYNLDAVKLLNFPYTPFCNINCGPNLYCIRENICGCHEGYQVEISDDTGLLYCKPLCEQPCMDNGQCVTENVCECNEGYDLVDLDCKPRCSTSCTNGYCSAPEVCECYDGYKWVGNACTIILEGYIKTTPSTTTTTTRKNAIKSSNSVSETPESSTSYFTATERSTEEFTSSKTTDTTYYTDSETSNTFDDSFQMVVDNGELPSDYAEMNEKMEIPKTYCPDEYIYYQGECRPMIREIALGKCNMKVCGPNAYCVQDGKCNCLPGFNWQFNADGNDISCKSLDMKTKGLRVEPHEHKHQWMSNMFTALGALCVTAAILCLLAVLYSHYK